MSTDPYEGVTGKDRERLDALLAWRDQTPVIAPKERDEPEATLASSPERSRPLKPSRKRGRRFSARQR